MASGFRFPYDIQSTLDPWRHKLGGDFDQVVAHLADRDRALEDYVDQLRDANLRVSGTGTPLSGTAPDPSTGTIPFKVQGGTSVQTTGAGGGATITFPVAFPNGLLTVSAINGDDTANPNVTVAVISTSLTQLLVRLRTASTGTALATTAVRIDWLAIGW